ncbi:MAG: NCS2 family permease [Chloroflexota bacterium]|nr:NCS2 family permease [Chloroflexota bacterium]
MARQVTTTDSAIASFFRFDERESTLRRELWAGLTTFMVMAYIIFVNPAILSFAGIPSLQGLGPDFNQVLAATCFSAGLMTLTMGLASNRPFALAPGMGLNAVVAFQLIVGSGLTWEEAMGVVVLEGLVITVLVLLGIREAVMRAIPNALKHAIGAGIGFFILFIGLVNGGLVRVPVETIPIEEGVVAGQPSTPLAVGALDNLPVFVTVIGLAITLLLFARGWQFALLAGIAITTVIAIILNSLTGFTSFVTGATVPEAIFAVPDFSFLVLPGVFGIPGVFKLGLISAILVVFSLMLTDFFDTMGTIIGVSEQMGDVGPEGEVENLHPMLLVDSLAASVGGALGASSVTTYIESAAGVAVGGRTGLTAVVVAVFFFLAMFFAPLAGVIPPQATAPALIFVGFLMASGLKEVNWSDIAEGFPALMTVLIMPFTFSITDGIGFGFISYVLIKAFQGRAREVHWMMWASAGAFLLFFALPWLRETFGF